MLLRRRTVSFPLPLLKSQPFRVNLRSPFEILAATAPKYQQQRSKWAKRKLRKALRASGGSE
jgi:hypothetical protein